MVRSLRGSSGIYEAFLSTCGEKPSCLKVHAVRARRQHRFPKVVFMLRSGFESNGFRTSNIEADQMSKKSSRVRKGRLDICTLRHEVSQAHPSWRAGSGSFCHHPRATFYAAFDLDLKQNPIFNAARSFTSSSFPIASNMQACRTYPQPFSALCSRE